MSDLLQNAFSALSGDDWDEIPVEIEEFVTSEEYLALPPLSEYQYQMIRAGSQIYKEDTLINLYGEEKGLKRFEDTCNEVILQLGKGCHAPYTPVFNPESGKWIPLSSATTDGMVVSSDGKSHYATESFVEGFGDMVRVKTALGFEEDVYVGHKYLAYKRSDFYRRARGREATYQEISQLSVGDRIAIATGFDVSKATNIPVEHAELIGYWLGDGMIPRSGQEIINMDFSADEHESITRYEELCEFIGDSPTKTHHKTKSLVFFRHGKNSKAVALAREYGLWGMRSHDKAVPDAVWAGSNEIISATLSKLWQTDGCVYRKNGLTAEFVSVSRQLAVDVQRMLLRLGVPASIRFRTPKSNYANASEAGYVTVSSQEAIVAFMSAVSLLDHKNIAPEVKVGPVYKRLSDGLYYDRITSIEPIGQGEYWTRTVPDTGNYIGNGMVSANSGKDYSSTIVCSYIVYLLLCLRDPAKYYGKPSGDTIDILNIAVNADQARNVFFANFKKRITGCRWFDGKYTDTQNGIIFDKSIRVFSGHSEREAFEGLNLFVAVLDEISAFALENSSGNPNAKTADATYKMYRASVDSRFPDYGKVLLLSFPRYKDDYIQQRYDAVVAEKEVITKKHKMKYDPDMPEGVPGNEFEIEWEEDHIIRYKYPRMFALRRPTWEINPLVTLDSPAMVRAAAEDIGDFLGRFACMPSTATEGFFRNHEAIEAAFVSTNGVDEDGVFRESFKPKEDTKYFIHVDLAQKHDHCVVAMAHVDKWVEIKIGASYSEMHPEVVIDAIRWWTPSEKKTVEFSDVREYILSLRRRGFDIRLCTFDRWNSHDTMNILEKQGIKTDNLSVDKKHYDDYLSIMYDGRLIGPKVDLLMDELKELRPIHKPTKVIIDHPRKGTKDFSDATCGAIYNAVSLTKKPEYGEIEVRTLADVQREERERLSQVRDSRGTSGVIKPPVREAPEEIQSMLQRLRII